MLTSDKAICEMNTGELAEEYEYCMKSAESEALAPDLQRYFRDRASVIKKYMDNAESTFTSVAGVVGIISVIVGVALKMNNNAIAIIGGVDGPTSVFVAGKLNSVLVSILLIAIGVVMLIVAIIFYFLKKK